MDEQIKRYYDYLIKQKELTKSWIKEALDKDADTKTLNSRLQFVMGAIEVYNYTFKDYLPKQDDQEVKIESSKGELPF